MEKEEAAEVTSHCRRASLGEGKLSEQEAGLTSLPVREVRLLPKRGVGKEQGVSVCSLWEGRGVPSWEIAFPPAVGSWLSGRCQIL